MAITSERLAILRLSSPEAAFKALLDDFSAAVINDPEMEKAFASFQKNFKGEIFSPENATRFERLQAQGVDQLAIKIGELPLALSVGLASMYDTTVEALRSNDNPIDPKKFSARAIGAVERLLDLGLLQIGELSVAALEIALNDRRYADRLLQRASEVGDIVHLDQPFDPTCEHCTITQKDSTGVVIQTTCPSKEECERLGGLLVLVLLIWLTVKILDWLF